MSNNSIKYTVVGLLIVIAPLIILALHNYNRVEQFLENQDRTIIQFITSKPASVEEFAASQGGALVQLAASHVATEDEVTAGKRQVERDIVNMTEPE